MLLKADTSELVQLANAFDAAALAVEESRPVVLRAIGVQLLSWGFKDFRTKSTGDTGEDGVTWPPIQDSTIEARVSGHARYQEKQKVIDDAKKSIKNHEGIFAASLKGMRKAARGSDAYKAAATKAKKARYAIAKQKRIVKRVKGAESESELKRAARKQKGAAKRIARAQKQLEAAKSKRAKIRSGVVAPKEHGQTIARLQTKVDRAKKAKDKFVARLSRGAKIGIDTGRLVNSLMFGVPELKMRPEPGTPKKNAPSESVKPAVFQTDHSSVTVGTQMSYATAFDEVRPIFGANFINAQRREQLEELANRATRIYLRQAAERIKPAAVGMGDLQGGIE